MGSLARPTHATRRCSPSSTESSAELGAITLRRASERAAGTALVAAAATLLAVAAALHVIGGHELEAALPNGRLYFPIDYANAQAAAFLVGFWPAVLLAARRDGPVLLRSASLGCASALLAGWIFTQSKGGGVALAVSAVVVLAVSPARLRLLVPAALACVPAALAFTRLVAPYDHVSDAGVPRIGAGRRLGPAHRGRGRRGPRRRLRARRPANRGRPSRAPGGCGVRPDAPRAGGRRLDRRLLRRREPPGLVARRSLALVQAPADDGDGELALPHHRLEPLRLLARRRHRVRPSPARRHRRPRLRDRICHGGPQHRVPGARPLVRARHAQRGGHRRLRPARRRARGAADRRRARARAAAA